MLSVDLDTSMKDHLPNTETSTPSNFLEGLN